MANEITITGLMTYTAPVDQNVTELDSGGDITDDVNDSLLNVVLQDQTFTTSWQLLSPSSGATQAYLLLWNLDGVNYLDISNADGGTVLYTCKPQEFAFLCLPASFSVYVRTNTANCLTRYLYIQAADLA